MKKTFKPKLEIPKGGFLGRLIAYFIFIFAPFSWASQSSIQQRTSYNSDKQLTFSVSGTWGFDERAFANASFTNSRTPLGETIGVTGVPIGDIDTFYQGTLGAGYAIDNFGFDLGVSYSTSPLTRTTTVGGYIGLTYIFTSEFSDPASHSEQALDMLHTQIYEKNQEHPPLFWVRIGFIGNSMRSGVVDSAFDSGKQTSLTIDTYYPLADDLLAGLGAAFHTYDDTKGFFSITSRNTANNTVGFLGSTLQGLPHTSLSAQLSYQLAQRDAFVPRYQATEIDSTRTWSHTIDLGWRHQFTKKLFMTPTYEVSMQSDRTSTGLIVEFLYLL